MKVCNLSFGKIVVLNKNLAEVIVNEGVHFNEAMVDEYHNFLLSNLSKPFALLVNKKHSYSYAFEAQKQISSLSGIQAIAVVVFTSASLMATKTLMNVNRTETSNIKIFQDRDKALLWLIEEINS
ncbi:hypothetical protein [Gelatiniphilus marinus]|uniref:STAS/SEC14 domain-containing protein n=1 Tax=Gelatiniphilus marinus TaxID=1759464 RepID=A0ABW5JTM7_9FLAO